MQDPAQRNKTQSGVNSWLDEELYQQYRYDRRTVDEDYVLAA